MPRPCYKKHPDPNRYRLRCHHCNLYIKDERWRAYWDGPDSPTVTVVPMAGAPPRIIPGRVRGFIARNNETAGDYTIPPTDPTHPDNISTRKAQLRADTCRHFGRFTGNMEVCGTCPGNVQLKLFQCEVHGACTVSKTLPNVACCETCPDYRPRENIRDTAPMLTWTCGITTVYSRKDDLLPRTLASIEAAGFPRPTIFIDGVSFKVGLQYEEKFGAQGYNVEVRRNRVHAWGNWLLGLWELYLRSPSCDRYVMFQDDVVLCKNVKRYLECCAYPNNGYWNLYTNPQNQTVVPRTQATRRQVEGWHPSNQMGYGALALVFDNTTVVKMLGHHHFPRRTKDAERGHHAIDGAVVAVFNVTKGTEYIHHPSLCQHIGEYSTIQKGNKQKFGPSKNFPGEGYDTLKLLRLVEVNREKVP